MPSASPSPVKRPSITERTPSQASQSPSNKQNAGHKPHRPHVIGRHSRNISHGKNLSKLNRVQSTANVISEPKHHQRKRSGPTTPQRSPTSPGLPKRNTSHVALTKNLSHGNLRKNHSATTLGHNTSHPGLKKIGLAPAPKPKDQESKKGFFELGDASSGEDDENEWEDSATQSPEFTRNNSKASTPARVATPNGERLPSKSHDLNHLRQKRTSSPPSPVLKTNNRSLPNLRKDSDVSAGHANPQDPALLNHNIRASRAPPAMSTISAVAGPGLLRSESSKSFTHIDHTEAASMHTTPGGMTTDGLSSAGNGVSHFLSQTPISSKTSRMHIDDASDEDSTNFMSNYKPLPSESPEKSRTMNKTRFASTPSRTQQKLELQRREAMRSGPGPATPPSSMGMAAGSSLSLHSRSGSRGGNRTLGGELKAQKITYETGVKQLLVVRRFRNPILESLHRMKDAQSLPADIGMMTPSGAAGKSRPPSRRGLNGSANGVPTTGVSRSLEWKKPSPMVSRSNSRGRGGRVHFQRQGSHDDIGITPAQDSPDGAEYEDTMSPEEALMRRLWNSREVYDAGEAAMAR